MLTLFYEYPRLFSCHQDVSFKQSSFNELDALALTAYHIFFFDKLE